MLKLAAARLVMIVWIVPVPAIAADLTETGMLKLHMPPPVAIPRQLSADDHSHSSTDGFTAPPATLLSTAVMPNLAPVSGFHPVAQTSVEAGLLLPGIDPNPLALPSSIGLTVPPVASPTAPGDEICPVLASSLAPHLPWTPTETHGLANTPPIEAGVGAPIAGGPTQTLKPSAGSSWCQPATLPFDDSSPLTSRSLWLPLIILTIAACALLGTRRRAIIRPSGRGA